MKNDIVFRCRKCGHLLFIDRKKVEEKLVDLLQSDDEGCPNCGEESQGNWILERFGNYDKEYGNKK